MNKKKVALGVGLGLAAAAAAGAGYYFYGAKGASANRKKVSKWANDFRARVIREAKKVKKLDEKAFKTIVNESMKAYAKVQSIDKKDLDAAARELQKNWKTVERELKRVAAKDRVVAKKVVAKVKKTVAKRVPRKQPAKKKKA